MDLHIHLIYHPFAKSDASAQLEKNGLDSQGIQPVRFARPEGRSTQ